MPKILSPGFPPRRPSGVVRSLLVAIVLVIMIYLYKFPNDSPSRPLAGAGTNPVPGSPPYNADGSNLHRPESKPSYVVDPDDDRPAPKPNEGPSTPAITEEKQKWWEKEDGDRVEGKGHKEVDYSNSGSSVGSGSSTPSDPDDTHPINRLIYDAQLKFAELASKETHSLSEAAQAYRKRRGRHPPPGFDQWFEFAQNNSALVVEDFFDQIYHDLQPFWGLEPAIMRKESWDFEMTINIRDGNASTISNWFWTTIWHNMTQSIAHLLPDMDLPLNPMDEPRHVVPWEDMDKYMQKAAKTVNLPKASKVRGDFQKLPKPGKGDLKTKTRDRDFEETGRYWDIARRGCPPDSLARTEPLQKSFDITPKIDMAHAEAHMHKGFVSNYTLSTDICHQPDLQGLEGILIEPISTSSSKIFAPLFGGSKLGVNNEILLPAPMYWSEEERFTGGGEHGGAWGTKENMAVWRGVATGGKNRVDNWRGFQRHRFVAMNNGTKLAAAEKGQHEPENFAMPEEQYQLRAQEDGKLGQWVDRWADVAFINLMCEPNTVDGTCSYTSPYFDIREGISMAEQFYYKYVPDIDGNSFSGRYLGFLRSTSLPIKATIFREWHDSRLVPWKHFVPMDNRFGDYYGIMEYFLGYRGANGHDQAAEKIANDGKEWAEKVLRKEDMQIYTLRLLLEYARLLDDRRDSMGWVDDALKDPSLEETWSWWW